MKEVLEPSWTIPFAFDAKPHARGGFASVGGYYANYKGREMTMGEFIAGYGIDGKISVWVGRQSYLLKGRHAGNRLELNDDIYGVKWAFKTPEYPNEPYWAVEAQVTRPGSASAVAGNSSATYFATKNYSVALDYRDPKGLLAQLSYANTKGAATGDAHVIGLAAAKDLRLKNKLRLRVQGNLYAQSYTDVVEKVGLELKPQFYAAVAYEAAPWLRVEADGSLLPFGMPIAGSHYTGLSSFQIYRPGGVAEELRDNFVAFASLRLVFHGKF